MNIHETLVERNCLFLNTGKQFVGNSDDHLTGYCNIDPLLPHVKLLDQVSKDMADPFMDTGFEVVLDAAVGAIPLGVLVAKYAIDTTGRDIKAVFADKKEPRGQEIDRDGFGEALEGKKVLLVDGVVNSGFTTGQLLVITKKYGCEVVGMTCVAAKQNVTAKSLGVAAFRALDRFDYDSFKPNECAEIGPCSQGIEIVEDLGHGKQFKLANPNYAGGYVELLKSA